MELGGSDTPGDVPRSSRRARVIRTLAPQTFLEVTDEEVDRALRYDRPLSVLMGQLEGVVRIRKAEGALGEGVD